VGGSDGGGGGIEDAASALADYGVSIGEEGQSLHDGAQSATTDKNQADAHRAESCIELEGFERDDAHRAAGGWGELEEGGEEDGLVGDGAGVHACPRVDMWGDV